LSWPLVLLLPFVWQQLQCMKARCTCPGHCHYVGYPSFKALPTLRPENTAYFLPTLLFLEHACTCTHTKRLGRNPIPRASPGWGWAFERSREYMAGSPWTPPFPWVGLLSKPPEISRTFTHELALVASPSFVWRQLPLEYTTHTHPHTTFETPIETNGFN
jgi:hypothetical protein